MDGPELNVCRTAVLFKTIKIPIGRKSFVYMFHLVFFNSLKWKKKKKKALFLLVGKSRSSNFRKQKCQRRFWNETVLHTSQAAKKKTLHVHTGASHTFNFISVQLRTHDSKAYEYVHCFANIHWQLRSAQYYNTGIQTSYHMVTNCHASACPLVTACVHTLIQLQVREVWTSLSLKE